MQRAAWSRRCFRSRAGKGTSARPWVPAQDTAEHNSNRGGGRRDRKAPDSYKPPAGTEGGLAKSEKKPAESGSGSGGEGGLAKSEMKPSERNVGGSGSGDGGGGGRDRKAPDSYKPPVGTEGGLAKSEKKPAERTGANGSGNGAGGERERGRGAGGRDDDLKTAPKQIKAGARHVMVCSLCSGTLAMVSLKPPGSCYIHEFSLLLQLDAEFRVL